jgi:hypothetical protein
MGFLDKIKKAFDTGGISAELDAPGQFRWSDETLPVRLILKGHESEPRTVNSVLFRLRESDSDDENRTAREREREGISYEYNETIELQPGESVTIEIEFPLTVSEILDRAGVAEEIPGWLSTAAKVMDSAAKLSTDSDSYRISATPNVEGAKIAKGVSRRIRQVGMGDAFIGNLI